MNAGERIGYGERQARLAFWESWARFLLSVAMLTASAGLIGGRVGAGLVLGLVGAVLMASLALRQKKGSP